MGAGKQPMSITIRRVYDKPGKNEGFRVLVDRVWPRGVSREEAGIDDWNKDVAPSAGLRKWFGHEPGKWAEFRKRYWQELDDNLAAVASLLEKVRKGRVTLVFGARDQQHNNAVALREYIERKAGERTGAEPE